MSVTIAWARGGEARVESLDGEAIVLRSSVASPPGARIDGTIGGAASAHVRVKVHACRRQPEGDFVIEGRTIDLRREVRERIAGR